MTHARPACDAKNCAVSNANQCESGACRWDFGGKSMTPTNAQDLHAQIMNLTCNYPVGNAREYREGYRDARHAAAELVSAQAEQADAQIARFVAAVNVQTAEIERLRDVIERLSAVVNAAQEWAGERSVSDWDEAELMKALWTFNGDRDDPCPECDGECGEPCAPSTVVEAHAAIDAQLDDLVMRGKLHRGEPISGLTPNV
jgi:hypothetical protein